ncbi:MAG: nucleotidyltransferase family protein [Flavobacteriaceae bacterium]|nr:nucleotidyltransferase family protein [Flavobacteriaceae bacterium]
MESNYKKILNISLSSLPLNDKVQLVNDLWSSINEEKLYKYASTDEVSSHLAFVLKSTDLKYKTYWDKDFQKINSKTTILMDTLEKVASKLKEYNIEIVALKNAGIAKGLYSNYACSPMGDLDLLIRTNDFKKAHEVILNELGFIFKFRSEFEFEDLDEAFRSGGTEYYKIIDGYKVWLELQWRPIAGRWIQPNNEPNGNELMRNSMSIKNSSVKILAPEDNLLQVALHTAKHSYVRAPGFRLHSDVDRVIRFQQIDWTRFENGVLKLKLKTAVYFSLFFAKDLLGTSIPKEVLKKLRPTWYREIIIRHYIKKAGIYNQKNKKFSKLGYILFNLSLYDSIGENLLAIFPPFDSLKIRYPIKNKWSLPYFYLIRIKDLLFKRAKL